MNIRELVEILNRYDSELEVVVTGYEGGTDPVVEERIQQRYVDKSAGTDWCGEYGDDEDGPEGMKTPITVVLIERGGHDRGR